MRLEIMMTRPLRRIASANSASSWGPSIEGSEYKMSKTMSAAPPFVSWSTSLACKLPGHGHFLAIFAKESSSMPTTAIGRLDLGAVLALNASNPLSSIECHAGRNPSAPKSRKMPAATLIATRPESVVARSRPAKRRRAAPMAARDRLATRFSMSEPIAYGHSVDIGNILLEEVGGEGFDRPALVVALLEDVHLRVPTRA